MCVGNTMCVYDWTLLNKKKLKMDFGVISLDHRITADVKLVFLTGPKMNSIRLISGLHRVHGHSSPNHNGSSGDIVYHYWWVFLFKKVNPCIQWLCDGISSLPPPHDAPVTRALLQVRQVTNRFYRFYHALWDTGVSCFMFFTCVDRYRMIS